jgi:hypothetical protein
VSPRLSPHFWQVVGIVFLLLLLSFSFFLFSSLQHVFQKRKEKRSSTKSKLQFADKTGAWKQEKKKKAKQGKKKNLQFQARE